MSADVSAAEPNEKRVKDPLLQSFQIKKLTLKNRIMSTSHACGLEVSGFPMEAYQRYHEEKAIGGIALSMFGGSSNVAIDSPNVFRQLNVSTDEIISHLQCFSERMHAHDSALMCQITHLGRRGEPYAGEWLPTVAPSPIRETLHRSIPKEMDDHDIARIVQAYADAARRCREGGLDGIEVVGGGHLIGQFLSPVTNRRTDAFGGSLENRCRFGLMVFEAMRHAVGNDFLLGFRHVVDEGPAPGALNFDQSTEIALLFERAGHVDFFNALYGKFDTERALAIEYMPGMESPIAPWLSVVGAFKREVKLPVFHAARISDVATARHAIGDGLLDMVAMTRPHIADPHIVRKLERGAEEEIRPCVGATHCQSNFRPHCLHNAATGRELVLTHSIEKSDTAPKRVVIVGAGPAGLEAGRICALRGHHVLLLEAADQVGGQLILAARDGWRRDMIGIVDWRRGQLAKLGVEVRTNCYADAEIVQAERPDIVILATGGIPDLDIYEGGELMTSVWDVIGGTTSIKDDAVVYDGTGRHPALIAASMVHENGGKMRIASIDGQLAQELTYAERHVWKKKAAHWDVPVFFDCELERAVRAGNGILATFRNIVTLEAVEMDCAQLIVECGTAPLQELFFDLRKSSRNDGVLNLEDFTAARRQSVTTNENGSYELYRIGDAVASRNVHTAMLDANRLCKEL